MGLMDWIKNLFGGSKEEQSQGDAQSMPEQSSAPESQGEAAPKSEEHEHHQ